MSTLFTYHRCATESDKERNNNKTTTKNAERHKHITEHQYGGRQGREAIDVPVLQAWHIEIFTIAQNNVAFTDCDAKECYDRIIPTALALAQIQAGLPLQAASTEILSQIISSLSKRALGVVFFFLAPAPICSKTIMKSSFSLSF